MKTTVAHAFTLLSMVSLLSFSGCIQMEHDLRINEDGSAVYSLDYSITDQAVTQFRAMFKLKKDLAVANGEPPPGPELEPLLLVFLDPNEADIRKQIEPFADSGVSIRSIRQESRAASRHVELQLDIANIGMLADNPFFKKHGFSLHKNEAGQYVWSRPPHIDEGGMIVPPPNARDLEQIAPFLAGFKTVIKITPPGRIVSTTASRTTLQTAIWEFDFNRQPTAVQTLLRQNFYIVFDAPQANLPELRQP